jgi:hypothetical protein
MQRHSKKKHYTNLRTKKERNFINTLPNNITYYRYILRIKNTLNIRPSKTTLTFLNS